MLSHQCPWAQASPLGVEEQTRLLVTFFFLGLGQSQKDKRSEGGC